jgi:predicted CoA-binding protein
MLKEYGHEVVCFGKRKGECAGEPILNEFPENGQFDSVTLYINPDHQLEYYQKIIELKPKRVIFNPGTENDEFEDLLSGNQIVGEEACTLVLLRTGQF